MWDSYFLENPLKLNEKSSESLRVSNSLFLPVLWCPPIVHATAASQGTSPTAMEIMPPVEATATLVFTVDLGSREDHATRHDKLEGPICEAKHQALVQCRLKANKGSWLHLRNMRLHVNAEGVWSLVMNANIRTGDGRGVATPKMSWSWCYLERNHSSAHSPSPGTKPDMALGACCMQRANMRLEATM
jgi:hypothetical protein